MKTSDLKANYIRVEPRAKRLKLALSAELTHLLEKEEITLGVPIESRVKEWTSIEEKINRKSLGLKKLKT